MTADKLSPEIADAFAATLAAADHRGWSRGFEAGYQAGYAAGATAQKELMEQAAPPTPHVIVMDEGGAEVVRDLMENPDA